MDYKKQADTLALAAAALQADAAARLSGTPTHTPAALLTWFNTVEQLVADIKVTLTALAASVVQASTVESPTEAAIKPTLATAIAIATFLAYARKEHLVEYIKWSGCCPSVTINANIDVLRNAVKRIVDPKYEAGLLEAAERIRSNDAAQKSALIKKRVVKQTQELGRQILSLESQYKKAAERQAYEANLINVKIGQMAYFEYPDGDQVAINGEGVSIITSIGAAVVIAVSDGGQTITVFDGVPTKWHYDAKLGTWEELGTGRDYAPHRAYEFGVALSDPDFAVARVEVTSANNKRDNYAVTAHNGKAWYLIDGVTYSLTKDGTYTASNKLGEPLAGRFTIIDEPVGQPPQYRTDEAVGLLFFPNSSEETAIVKYVDGAIIHLHRPKNNTDVTLYWIGSAFDFKPNNPLSGSQKFVRANQYSMAPGGRGAIAVWQ